MSTSAPGSTSLAEQLLDAQVSYHLDQLTGDQLAATVSALADEVLAAASRHKVEDLVEREAIKAIVVNALRTVPASEAVGSIVEMVTTLAYDGPAEPYPLGELVDRERVEALVDALLALTPALEEALERQASSPLVGTVASRFMGRIVADVMQTNQAAASKVPGLGSLMSIGTGAASKVKGVTDKQVEALVGNSLDKGGTFAVRRLNRILVATLQDPTTREAVLQVWDQAAQAPMDGLSSSEIRAEVDGVVDAALALVIATLATDRAAQLAETAVDGFFQRFGAHTPIELLDELGLDRDLLVADTVRIVPRVVDAARESGDLERLLRTQLEPFYHSPEVAALLA